MFRYRWMAGLLAASFLWVGCVTKSYHQKKVAQLSEENQNLEKQLEQQKNRLQELRKNYENRLSRLEEQNSAKANQLRRTVAYIRRLEEQLGLSKDLYGRFTKVFRAQVNTENLRLSLRNGLLVLTLPDRLTFSYNSAALTDSGRRTIQQVADELKRHNSFWQVAGHADATGTDDYNRRLSFRRADRVLKVLLQNGMSAQKVYVAAYGESRPIATNETSEGRAMNRRVEIMLQPQLEPINIEREELSKIKAILKGDKTS